MVRILLTVDFGGLYPVAQLAGLLNKDFDLLLDRIPYGTGVLQHLFLAAFERGRVGKGPGDPLDISGKDRTAFGAFAVTTGITFTFGGLKITTAAEVVDTEEKPLPGLYAAGELVGGIFYFNYPSGSGLMNGAVFGRAAGQNAARYAQMVKQS